MGKSKTKKKSKGAVGGHTPTWKQQAEELGDDATYLASGLVTSSEGAAALAQIKNFGDLMDSHMMVNVNTILQKNIMPSTINVGTMNRVEGNEKGSEGVTCNYPILYTATTAAMMARLSQRCKFAPDLTYMFRGYSAETYDKLAVTLDNLNGREVVYIPLRKMWETIRHDRVDLSLVRLSIPPEIVQFMRSTLTNARIRFRTPENGVTAYVPLDRGLKPDDPLSQIFVQAIMDTICSMLGKERFQPFAGDDDDDKPDNGSISGTRYDKASATENREKVTKLMADNEINASGNLRFVFPNAMVLVGDKERIQNALTQTFVLMGVHGVDTRIEPLQFSGGGSAGAEDEPLQWGLTADEKAQLDEGTKGNTPASLKAGTEGVANAEEAAGILRAVMENGVQEAPWGWDPEMDRAGGWDPVIAKPPTSAGWDSSAAKLPGPPGSVVSAASELAPPPAPGTTGEENFAGTGTGGYEMDEGLTPAQIRKREKRLAAKAKKDAAAASAATEAGSGEAAGAAAEEALPDLG